MQIITSAMWIATRISAPILLTSIVAGVLVGILQSVTQIQEQTLSFVPKLIGAAIVIAVSGAWMLDEAVTFGHELMARAPEMING